MSENEIENGEQKSYMPNEVILLLLVGLLLIIIFGCYIYRKNSKKCKKGCKCNRRKSCTKESYRTLTPSNDVFVLQTTDTGDLSKINITPIIKNCIDDKSVNNTASFSIKDLTTVGNVKGGQLCIGTTCLTEGDLKNLKMITTSSLNSNDITLLKALGKGAYMQMDSNTLGKTFANGYGYPSYDNGVDYITKSGISTFRFFV